MIVHCLLQKIPVKYADGSGCCLTKCKKGSRGVDKFARLCIVIKCDINFVAQKRISLC